jgi:formimidoylglutamase
MEKDSIGNFCKAGFSFAGFPDDLGVKNVNGRIGASGGPASFWDYFQRLKGRRDLKAGLRHQEMALIGSDLTENHDAAVRTVQRAIGAFSGSQDSLLVVGGGHDYAYPWIKAFVESAPKELKIGCINIDAHFDLRPWRPVMTSGSPFRRLIEENLLAGENLVEFGIQEHCNSGELFEYASQVGIKVVPFPELRAGRAVSEFRRSLLALGSKCDLILLSVDLDAVSFAFAPGVSAPQAEGFTGSELIEMMEIAGSDKKVASLGFFELAPSLDFQDLTSRLAAQAAWHFLSAKNQ